MGSSQRSIALMHKIKLAFCCLNHINAFQLPNDLQLNLEKTNNMFFHTVRPKFNFYLDEALEWKKHCGNGICRWHGWG